MLSRLDELRAGVDALTPLFVLVDPMVGEPLPGMGTSDAGADARALREQAWGREIVPIVLARTIALPAHQHPYLVRLHGPDDPLLELTLDIADGERLAAQSRGLDGEGRAAHRIGGWMQSSMHFEELAAILSAMCRVNTDAHTKATYLRLADRRALDLLCHVAGDSRVASQFGRLQSWAYLDAFGRLRRLRSRDERPEPLRLSAAEWRQMERGEMLHRTIAQWLGETLCGEGAPPQTVYPSAEIAVSNAASAARKWPHRFENSTDETVWAALSMLHPAMPQLPAVLALLDDRGTEDEPPEPLRYLHRDLSAIAQQAGAGAHLQIDKNSGTLWQ
ncbi:DUF4123 domain-containing protein [Pseudoduganella sp. LjRoot289]|uniref:hypothetical protein n=1 Tax=Pseudoduganella sp. LjRoot289 TaxID=3342314 RepID=UPI003ECDEEDF